MWILTASRTRNELILSSRDSSFFCRVGSHLNFLGSFLVVFVFPVRGCIHRVIIVFFYFFFSIPFFFFIPTGCFFIKTFFLSLSSPPIFTLFLHF